MGFLDNLRDAFTTPLSNPTERKYYEIAFNLLRLIHIGDYDQIKAYVEFTEGQPCDEEQLKRALKCIKSRTDDGKTYYLNYSDGDRYSNKRTEIIYNTYKEILEKVPFSDIVPKKRQAFGICYKEQIKSVKLELDKVLDVIKDNPTKEYLNQGIAKIKSSYKNVPGFRDFDYLLYIAIRQSFFEGNEIIRNIVFEYFYNVLVKRAQGDRTIIFFSAVAFRALNFEKNLKDDDKYSTFSFDECREFVLNHDAFISVLDNHPFDKDKYADGFANEIKNVSVFYDGQKREFLSSLFDSDLGGFWNQCSDDDYFIDAVCHHIWETIKVNNTNDSTNIGEVIDMIYRYATSVN